MALGFAISYQTLTRCSMLAVVCFCISVLGPRFRHVSGPEEKQNLMASAFETEINGVKIHHNPSELKLAQLGVASWPKWECGPSKFPWTFSATETMYMMKGKVIVYVDGKDEEPFEIGGDDLVVFPKGMKVIWDVIEGVSKRYSLEK